MTAEDASRLRRWSIAPGEFLLVEDLLACAEAPGAATLVGLDAEGRLIAVFQSVPAGCDGDGVRSVSLLVHPGRRRRGFGRDLAGRARRTVSRAQRPARRHRPRQHGLAALLRGVRVRRTTVPRNYEVLVRRSPKPYFATASVAR
jgi:GNAT superfamily N-acetyltransferase